MLPKEYVLPAVLLGAAAILWVITLLMEIRGTLQAIRQTQDVVIDRLDRLIAK